MSARARRLRKALCPVTASAPLYGAADCDAQTPFHLTVCLLGTIAAFDSFSLQTRHSGVGQQASPIHVKPKAITPRQYTRKTTWGKIPLKEMESAAAEVKEGKKSSCKG
ncbi:hypothetical protein QQF64_033897 [Cirrhinus molitorella]|uniref:Uncharacterized protein n=1 Tax=Cirrhinus molitorella TaxID=172907 RepID=A0ABR3MV57_9TELE